MAAGIGARLVFQPAEEVMPGGAEDVVAQDGLVGVDRIFALHCDPSLDVGQVGLRVGAITAAADQVEVTLTGRGGHTSRPHLTQDLTYALAKVVTDVPGVLSRRLDPRAGAALVWGSVHSGGAYNVIPAIGKVGGTLRMLDASVWEGVERLLEEVVHAVVAPYAVQAEVSSPRACPRSSTTPRASTRSPRRSPGRAPTSRPRRSRWAARTSRGTSPTCPAPWPGSAPARRVGPTYDLHRGDLVVDEGADHRGRPHARGGGLHLGASRRRLAGSRAALLPWRAVADR